MGISRLGCKLFAFLQVSEHMAYRDSPTEDRAPILVIPREEFSWWQRKKCAYGRHTLENCQFVILRQAIFAGHPMGTVHFDPGRVVCRCCSAVMARHEFTAKELQKLSTFQHAIFSDTWEDAREYTHPGTILLHGTRCAWYNLEFGVWRNSITRGLLPWNG